MNKGHAAETGAAFFALKCLAAEVWQDWVLVQVDGNTAACSVRKLMTMLQHAPPRH